MAISIDKQMDKLRARKGELQDEIDRIEQIEATLELAVEEAIRSIDSAGRSLAAGSVKAAKRATTPARKRAASAGTGQRGRPKGTGKRQAQAVKIVTAAPGIRTSEVAKKMGIGPNYLYRLLPELAEENLVVKRGSGWYPAGGGSNS